MASKLSEIEKEINLLPEHDRAILAKNILLSLENYDEDDEANIEKKWIEESKRRLNEFEKDESIGIPFEDVFRELRAKYQ